jgi:hypothetical protein
MYLMELVECFCYDPDRIWVRDEMLSLRLTMEDAMNTPRLDLPPKTVAPSSRCRHSRLIDRVLTAAGEETGTVRCLECGAIIPDPVPASARQ